MVVTQIVLQPVGLFLIPLAFVIAVPFGWTFAFFQNVTVLGGVDGRLKGTVRQAWRLTRLWPMQNHNLLFIFILFGALVLFNISVAAITIPFLVKMLVGVESAITQSPAAALNSTFLAAALALAWLCVDPFVKAAYVLRCFHGGSLRTGEDLLAELRRWSSVARRGALIGLAALTFSGAGVRAGAADDSIERTRQDPADRGGETATIAPAQLDRAIGEVLQEREYTWRLPRQQWSRAKQDQSWLAQLVESVFETIGDVLKTIGGWVEDLLRWIFGSAGARGGGLALDWISALKGLFVGVIVVFVGLLGYFVYRLWVGLRRQTANAIGAEAAPPRLDLEDDAVGADQLPEDGWLRMGRELIAAGELRLALRAFYLASLAHLADKSLITLARFKSNLDYERELMRRGHALPLLVALFAENVAVFERVWYGRHDASENTVNEFAGRVERLRTGGTAEAG
jgi:hypothetical protein